MATLTVRNVPEWVVDGLKARARRNGRSMEGEVRQILEEQVTSERVDFFTEWLLSWEAVRETPGPEFEVPAREDFGREVVFE